MASGSQEHRRVAEVAARAPAIAPGDRADFEETCCETTAAVLERFTFRESADHSLAFAGSEIRAGQRAQL